jgi:tRNA uridine 5-carboxymethylaminomethyl modification enzyme
VRFEDLTGYGAAIPDISNEIRDAIEVAIKYGGYIERQQRQIEKFRRMEDQRIPDGVRYGGIPGMRREACEKFNRIQPRTLGQASRIPGITASDVSILMVRLRTLGRSGNTASKEHDTITQN